MVSRTARGSHFRYEMHGGARSVMAGTVGRLPLGITQARRRRALVDVCGMAQTRRHLYAFAERAPDARRPVRGTPRRTSFSCRAFAGALETGKRMTETMALEKRLTRAQAETEALTIATSEDYERGCALV